MISILAQEYLERYPNSFEAYMALQRVLLRRYVVRGGSEEEWCARIAPAFRRRYARLVAAGE